MSKKCLDLEYMECAVKVKTGVKAGAIEPVIGPPICLYAVAVYGIEPVLS